jgi:hypothetical protein
MWYYDGCFIDTISTVTLTYDRVWSMTWYDDSHYLLFYRLSLHSVTVTLTYDYDMITVIIFCFTDTASTAAVTLTW